MYCVPESQNVFCQESTLDYCSGSLHLTLGLETLRAELDYLHPKGCKTPEDNLDTLQDVESRAFRCKNGALRFGNHYNRSSEVKVSKCKPFPQSSLYFGCFDSEEYNPQLQFIPHIEFQMIFSPSHCLIFLSYQRKTQPHPEHQHTANAHSKYCFGASNLQCRVTWYPGKTLMVPCHEHSVSTTCTTRQLGVGCRYNWKLFMLHDGLNSSDRPPQQ